MITNYNQAWQDNSFPSPHSLGSGVMIAPYLHLCLKKSELLRDLEEVYKNWLNAVNSSM